MELTRDGKLVDVGKKMRVELSRSVFFFFHSSPLFIRMILG